MRGFAELGDDGVNAGAGVGVGVFDIVRHGGVRDDLDGFVDVVEDDKLAIESKEQIGQAAIIGRGGAEFFAFVVADHVVAGVTDPAAGEGGEIGVGLVGAGRHEALEIGQGIGGREFAAGFAGFLNGGFSLTGLIDQPRAGGDETVAGDALAADDTLEQEGVVVAA